MPPPIVALSAVGTSFARDSEHAWETRIRRLMVEHVFTEEEKRLLAGLILTSTCFDRVDFRNADLSQAVFDHVSLVGCDFRGASLASASFRHCDLSGAHFDGATSFRGSRFDGTCLLGAVGLSRLARDHIRRTGGTFFLTP